jgi:hypothetical protein
MVATPHHATPAWVAEDGSVTGGGVTGGGLAGGFGVMPPLCHCLPPGPMPAMGVLLT